MLPGPADDTEPAVGIAQGLARGLVHLDDPVREEEGEQGGHEAHGAGLVGVVHWKMRKMYPNKLARTLVWKG